VAEGCAPWAVVRVLCFDAVVVGWRARVVARVRPALRAPAVATYPLRGHCGCRWSGGLTDGGVACPCSSIPRSVLRRRGVRPRHRRRELERLDFSGQLGFAGAIHDGRCTDVLGAPGDLLPQYVRPPSQYVRHACVACRGLPSPPSQRCPFLRYPPAVVRLLVGRCRCLALLCRATPTWRLSPRCATACGVTWGRSGGCVGTRGVRRDA
jgi:hypothetical protein